MEGEEIINPDSETQNETDCENETDREDASESDPESSSDSDWLCEEEGRRKAKQPQKRKMKTQGNENCSNSRQTSKHTVESKSQLPVTCGDKEGTLYLEKYVKVEKCILSEERWFTPTEFEKFGGKEKNKKWKTSILCTGIPLQNLIQDGYLSSPKFKRKRVHNERGSSPDSSPVDDSFRRRKHKRHRLSFSSSNVQSSAHQSVALDEDDNYDNIDMTVFQGAKLPVTCGSGYGVLHKQRFAKGHCGRCIRTEDFWLTPEDFIRLKKTDGTWRKDIMSHGIPLGKLVMKRVLELHAVSCECAICQGQTQDQENDDVCYVCDSEGDLVCCDECPRAFHLDCHLPAVNGDLGSQWSCTFCLMKNMDGSSQRTQQDVLNSPVSQYRGHCDYLLLYILHESTTDPCRELPDNSDNTAAPLTLGRVKSNLQIDYYQTVGDFVTAVKDVFHHCSSSDNDICGKASMLKDLFKKEFKRVFKIL